MRLSPAAALIPLAVAVALTACGPTGSTPTTTPGSTTTPPTGASTSPSPTSTALAADVLLQITATATAPGGATALLVETVTGPFAFGSLTTDEGSNLDTQCDPWRTSYATIGLIRAEYSATVTSGSWPSDYDVVIDAGRYEVFGGDVGSFQSYCASNQFAVPGNATSVAYFDAADGADGPNGWTNASFGFGYPLEPGIDVPGPADLTITGCIVVIGPAGAGSSVAAAWPGAPKTYNDTGCLVGDVTVS